MVAIRHGPVKFKVHRLGWLIAHYTFTFHSSLVSNICYISLQKHANAQLLLMEKGPWSASTPSVFEVFEVLEVLAEAESSVDESGVDAATETSLVTRVWAYE